MTWFSDPVRTPAGKLQRGLGRGVFTATPELVTACVDRDYRWDTQVDERAVYLARLVRDLRMPVAPLLDRLPSGNALGVLAALGRAGDEAAIDGLRRHVAAGPHWVEVLEWIATEWPVARWDDLLPVVLGRLPRTDDLAGLAWIGEPWRHWAARDERIAAEVARRQPAKRSSPLRDLSAERLLGRLGAATIAQQRALLRELNRRGPQAALLPLLDRLPLDELRGPVLTALGRLGPAALPVARAWAAQPDHPCRWGACFVLADHGGEPDVPVLLAAWDELDGRPDERCGYDDLAAGLARIGGDRAREVVPRLRRLWFSPHSYERAAILRATMALAPELGALRLVEGLWDCEADVRAIAAEHVPPGVPGVSGVSGVSRSLVEERLACLRDDPMETDEVRAAARARLA